MISWHRLFGLTLTDLFSGSSYQVELEKDLSLKQQFLDVLIIEKKEGTPPKDLPDGLDNLAAHNLMTYKSYQDIMNHWTIEELIGHYVNYRKIISSPYRELLPDESFRLYAISTGYPKTLLNDIDCRMVSSGVFDMRWGKRIIRLIVLKQIPKTENNSIWQLFSAAPASVRYGAEHYQWRTMDTSSVLNRLFEKYHIEGVNMPYTMEDFRREYVLDHLDRLSPDEVLNRYSADVILKRYSADEILKRYSADEILKRYSADEILKRFSPNDLLKGRSDKELLSLMKLIEKKLSHSEKKGSKRTSKKRQSVSQK